jgi:dTDP-4-dehydrorhamnose 3,5-epimerase
MIDMIIDIRKGSPNFGKIICYDMPSTIDKEYNEWIWIPPGFAHGNCFMEDTIIEYFCSGQYSPGCEASISPLAPDIDWSICDPMLKRIYDQVAVNPQFITDKDRNGFSIAKWESDDRSDQFLFCQL